MKRLILLPFIAAGLISTAVIAETLPGAVGAGVGAGVGAAKGGLIAPIKGVTSAAKCVDKTGAPILCTAAGAINTGASPVQGTVEGTVEGAVKGSGH